MNRMRIIFIVLHYKAYDMTEKCIDTLLNTFSSINHKIVVIDNGSNNGSGEKLKEKYNNCLDVDVILNSYNYGFANGNNIGYWHVKRKYNPNFIVIMNNDVLINDKLFLSKIEDVYSRTNFAVLGPDIINPILNNHQNPNRIMPRTYNEVKERYKSFSLRTKHPYLFYLLSNFRNLIPRSNTEEKNTNYINEMEDVVLHGSCLIFSEPFISSRDFCFNPNTFLFHEEDILYYECKKSNLKIVYSPKIIVEHYEDVSTNISFSSEFEKMKTKNEWLRDSAKVLLNVISESKTKEDN